MVIKANILSLACFLTMTIYSYSQAVPASYENIPFLVTFGKEAEMGWGDDDHNQIFFFSIPESHKTPFYIRVFDPDCGGMHDENKFGFNTKTTFTVYGGNKCFSSVDEENQNPVGNYKAGNMLAMKAFGQNPKYDNKWYNLGPFNPMEGAKIPSLGGYIFKVTIDGTSGDDGNLYRFFMSTSPSLNTEIEGGNAFTYEYTFRLPPKAKTVSHIYPFIDDKTISIKQYNFDFDSDTYLKVISVSKNGYKLKASKDGEWVMQEAPITKEEKNTSLDIQIHKFGDRINNNVVFRITNQYGENLRFYTVPIGGIPKYNYRIKTKRY